MKMPNIPEKRLDMLKDRVGRCVCRYCGGPLSLRQIDFNDFEDARIEIFCDACDRIEFGVEPEIYTSAAYYVDEFHVNPFKDLGDNVLSRKTSIAAICDILSWGLQHLGYLEQKGFVVPPTTEGKLLGECVTLRDEDLARFKEATSDD